MGMYQGVNASEGIGIGTVMVAVDPDLTFEPHEVADSAAEKERYQSALSVFCEKTQAQADHMKETVGEAEAEIMSGHIVLAQDPGMTDAINAAIDGGTCAEQALMDTSTMFENMFLSMDDEMFRLRAADIADIRTGILAELLGKEVVDLSVLPENTVVVVHDLTPSMTATIDKAHVAGIVTETGALDAGIAALVHKLKGNELVLIPILMAIFSIGGTTYDDFHHPPVYSYGATIYLATLKAARVVAAAMGDEVRVKTYEEQYARTQKELIRMLWNGRFFAYGCEKDGSGRRDDLLFTGQLGGQFVSRYCGWGDVVPMPMTRASVVSQFKISLSKTPDYYANKVWDIGRGHGIDNRGSQCWPFYLESYTAYAAMQAGYYDDALEIMRHIQLVNLRRGWSWCQNLWNPAELTYMTAPVVWFSTDVLAGAGLNVPAQELRLAPVVKGREKAVMPLYYPGFWARLTVDPARRKIKLQITKTFGERQTILSRIVSEHYGVPAEERKIIPIAPFTIREGAELDLSAHYKEIVQTPTERAVLPDAESVPFLTVDTAAATGR